ncbi:hypothetical protein ACLOJK_036613 [Asimina triloba]
MSQATDLDSTVDHDRDDPEHFLPEPIRPLNLSKIVCSVVAAYRCLDQMIQATHHHHDVDLIMLSSSPSTVRPHRPANRCPSTPLPSSTRSAVRPRHCLLPPSLPIHAASVICPQHVGKVCIGMARSQQSHATPTIDIRIDDAAFATVPNRCYYSNKIMPIIRYNERE